MGLWLRVVPRLRAAAARVGGFYLQCVLPGRGVSMSYAVKEIFYTLQCEGALTGRAAVFCRFAGCNLWSGREADRAAAVCNFCDTDFVGADGPEGGRFADAEALARRIVALWPAGGVAPFVV